MRRLLLFLCLLCACAQSLHAQIQVTLTIKRALFVMYEPVVATVTIANLSGRELPLQDADGQRWFGFEIVTADNGDPVAPIDSTYKLEPMIIPVGQTIKRTIILNSLYPIHNFGLYRVRATVYFSPLQKYFVSNLVNVEISEGKPIWQQIVGVPDGQDGAGGNRKLSLLTFRQPENSYLYVRVEDSDTGTVYCTSALGRLIIGNEPTEAVDVMNQLHIMQVVGPKAYLYTRVGLNGEILDQKTYLAVKARPTLHRDAAGNVTVRGGQVQDATSASASGAGPATGPGVPKLSDRPVDLPKD